MVGHRRRQLVGDSAITILEDAEEVFYSGDYSRAWRLARRAARDLELPAARQEALLLAAEAALARDRPSDARRALGEIDPGSVALRDRAALLDLGDAWLLAGDAASARRLLSRMCADDPADADVHYGLGLAAHECGDREAAEAAWLRCRKLDLEAPRPSWAPSNDEYEALVEKALEELPARAVQLLANVPVFVSPSPSEDMVADGIDPRLLGLFSGIPWPQQSSFGQPFSPDAVHIFSRNLERFCHHRSQLEEEIRTTVLHETAHYFGLDDDDLDAIGLG